MLTPVAVSKAEINMNVNIFRQFEPLSEEGGEGSMTCKAIKVLD